MQDLVTLKATWCARLMASLQKHSQDTLQSTFEQSTFRPTKPGGEHGKLPNSSSPKEEEETGK